MISEEEFTGDLTPEELMLHGRLRVLGIQRRTQAEAFRKAVEGLHTDLLAALRGLDHNAYHKAVDTRRFRGMYAAMRRAEYNLQSIDSHRHAIQAQLDVFKGERNGKGKEAAGAPEVEAPAQ